MPVEELVIEELDGRIVCRYFPPHVKLEAQLMQKNPWAGYATLLDSLIPEGEAISDKGISGGKAYEIKVVNGGGYYVCGPLGDGYREGWLWRLIPGRESNG